ncbi:uncharacterized protein LOC143462270 [Clavelina lepadiformis]|uniref:uncharacterized protein LOC143462270 n=1 Tax=Clavelina lepadiformis TaxID=159417 RepID=UPI004042FE43
MENLDDYQFSDDDSNDNNPYQNLVEVMKSMGYSEEKTRRGIEETGVSSNVSDLSIALLCEHLSDETMPLSVADTTCLVPPTESSNDYKAVQIFRPKPNNSGYELNQNELEKLFSHPDVVNKPVAIYSLAGTMRQGKSFLLNLFLRYLQSKRSNNWLQNKSYVINKGFGWRGGEDKCTEGIWIWTEPFEVQTKEGSLVIFLMDTQGTFDHETSIKGCSSIFALSTLISSVQIFNIMRQINESHLQHLQLFTEYGKMAKKNSHNQGGKDFQHLMFLVRDSFIPNKFGLEGGRDTLDRVLQVKQDHGELRSVRQHIRQSFEKVDCCLLPKPGDKVEVREPQSPTLTMQDVSQQFLVEVGKLAQYLFKDNLTAKRVNGCKVTGGDLINLIIAYCRVFESGNMPDIQPILEASAKAGILTLIQQCKSDYKETMKEMCGSNYVEADSLREIHEICKEGILTNFDQKPKLGEPSFIAQNKQVLSDQLDQIYDTVKQINNAKKEQMRSSIRDELVKAEEIFSSSLQQLSGGVFVNESVFNCICQDSKRMAMQIFSDSTKHFDQDLVEEYKTRLREHLKNSSQRFSETNRLRKIEFERKLTNVAVDAKKVYANLMEHKCDGKYLESSIFEKVHQESMQTALNKFEGCHNPNLILPWEEKRSEVAAELHQLKQRYEEDNDTNRKLIYGQILNTMSSIKEIYNKQMDKECGSSYATMDRFKRAHEMSKRQAATIIRSVEIEKGKLFADKCRAEMENILCSEKQKREAKNENYKAASIDEFKSRANLALKTYRQNIEENKNIYVIDGNLETNHQRFRLEALRVYTSMNFVEPKREYEEILEELKTDISTQYELGQQRNLENKQFAGEKAEQLHQELKAGYMTHMQQLCDAKYVEPDALAAEHKRIKRLILDRFQQQTGGLFPAITNKCSNEIEEIYRTVKTNNEKIKPSVFRKVGKALLGGAVGALGGFFLPPPGSTIFRFVTATVGGVIGFIKHWS